MPNSSNFLTLENQANSGAFGHNSIPEPTEAQCRANNYKLGHASLYGLNLAIEQPRGTYRTGIDAKTGIRWTSRMAAHYGFVKGTRGADGDGVDCFVGAFHQSETAYVVNQNVNGAFDEHKIIFAYPDEESARRCYRDSYDRNWTGLASMVPASISQIKWWLKHGNMKKPLHPDDLPPEGLEAMSQLPQWSADALPVNQTLDQLLYDIRRSDHGDNLMLDSVTLADIMEDSDGMLAFDALVVPFAALERKMTQLQKVMERSSLTVTPAAMQVTEPFSQRGVANVAAIFELSDGQTVSIYFHNPDVTPKKMMGTDEVISWKWLLNKKDITIVVAPERGNDLNISEVARRIMKLAEKNSAAFQRVNAKKAESMQRLGDLKIEITGLEDELKTALNDLEVAKIEQEDRVADTLKAATSVYRVGLERTSLVTIIAKGPYFDTTITKRKRVLERHTWQTIEDARKRIDNVTGGAKLTLVSGEDLLNQVAPVVAEPEPSADAPATTSDGDNYTWAEKDIGYAPNRPKGKFFKLVSKTDSAIAAAFGAAPKHSDMVQYFATPEDAGVWAGANGYVFGLNPYAKAVVSAKDDGEPANSEQNIELGKSAAKEVVDKKHDVKHAMYRAGLGWVDFPYGQVGEAPNAKGKRKGAKGISHIIEARMRKDGMTQKEAENFLNEIVVCIDQGAHSESRYADSKRNIAGTKSVLVLNGVEVVLMRDDGAEAWLMTGYEKTEAEEEIPSVEPGQDGGKTGSMHTGPMPLVRSVGAEGEQTVPVPAEPVNPDAASAAEVVNSTPVMPYQFATATPEALALLGEAHASTNLVNAYAAAVKIEDLAESNGMTVDWVAIDDLPVFDSLFPGIGSAGYLQGTVKHGPRVVMTVSLRGDGAMAFDIEDRDERFKDAGTDEDNEDFNQWVYDPRGAMEWATTTSESFESDSDSEIRLAKDDAERKDQEAKEDAAEAAAIAAANEFGIAKDGFAGVAKSSEQSNDLLSRKKAGAFTLVVGRDWGADSMPGGQWSKTITFSFTMFSRQNLSKSGRGIEAAGRIGNIQAAKPRSTPKEAYEAGADALVKSGGVVLGSAESDVEIAAPNSGIDGGVLSAPAGAGDYAVGNIKKINKLTSDLKANGLPFLSPSQFMADVASGNRSGFSLQSQIRQRDRHLADIEKVTSGEATPRSIVGVGGTKKTAIEWLRNSVNEIESTLESGGFMHYINLSNYQSSLDKISKGKVDDGFKSNDEIALIKKEDSERQEIGRKRDADIKEKADNNKKYSVGVKDGLKNPFEVTFTIDRMGDSVIAELSDFVSPQEKYDYLVKSQSSHVRSKGDKAKSTIQFGIGSFTPFGSSDIEDQNKIKLSRALKSGVQFSYFEIGPRPGYSLVTFVIDLSGAAPVAAGGGDSLPPAPVAPIETPASLIASIKTHYVDTRQIDVPADWIIMNAPRPLLGTQTIDNGELLTGRFYAAIDPSDSIASAFIKENIKLGAEMVLYAEMPVQIEMALEGAGEYRAAYESMPVERRTNAVKPLIRRIQGKPYAEAKAFLEAARASVGRVEQSAPAVKVERIPLELINMGFKLLAPMMPGAAQNEAFWMSSESAPYTKIVVAHYPNPDKYRVTIHHRIVTPFGENSAPSTDGGTYASVDSLVSAVKSLMDSAPVTQPVAPIQAPVAAEPVVQPIAPTAPEESDAASIDRDGIAVVEAARYQEEAGLNASTANYIAVLGAVDSKSADQLLKKAEIQSEITTNKAAFEFAGKHPTTKKLNDIKKEAEKIGSDFILKMIEVGKMRSSDKKQKMQEEAKKIRDDGIDAANQKALALGYKVGFHGASSLNAESFVSDLLKSKMSPRQSYADAVKANGKARTDAIAYTGALKTAEHRDRGRASSEGISAANVAASIQGMTGKTIVDFIKFNALNPAAIKSAEDLVQYGQDGARLGVLISTDGFGANTGKVSSELEVSGLIEDADGVVHEGLTLKVSGKGIVAANYGRVSDEWNFARFESAINTASPEILDFLAVVTKVKMIESSQPLAVQEAGPIVLNAQGGSESRGYYNWGRIVGLASGEGDKKTAMSSDAGASVRKAFAAFLLNQSSATTTPTESPQMVADKAFFQSVIDGTVITSDGEGILSASLFDPLTDAYKRHVGNAEMEALFEAAVNAFTKAELAASADL